MTKTTTTSAKKIASANFANAFIVYVNTLQTETPKNEADSLIDNCINLVAPLVKFDRVKAENLKKDLVHLKGFHDGDCTSISTIMDIAKVFGIIVH
jgi:hypothetical protein